jgi:DNA-binding NtrC family response regulator
MRRQPEEFRILVVDDEPEVLDLLEGYLKEQGEYVEGTMTAEGAIRRQQEKGFDLLVVDINLPDMNGIDLIGRVRQFDSEAEFVIITGYASLKTAVEAIRLGAFDYLVKPFKLEELGVAVKNAKEKILLRRLNGQLLSRLRSLYEEIERYGGIGTQAEQRAEEEREATKALLEHIRVLEGLRKRRFFID